MSEKLSDEKRAELVKHLTNMGWGLDQRGDIECTDEGSAMAAQEIEALAAANATLESALAEMTRQRDEALAMPKEPEINEAVDATTNKAGPMTDGPTYTTVCRGLIAARRRRILGDA